MVNTNITEKQLHRVIQTLWDIQQALSALTFLLEEVDFEKKYDKIQTRIFRCYESNLIISLARPFTQSRSGTTISLKALGITLTKEEDELLKNVKELRNEIIAHSSEDEMHFKTSIYITKQGINFVNFQFEESLLLDRQTLIKLETFLRNFKNTINDYLFQLSQDQPDLFDIYKKPDSHKN